MMVCVGQAGNQIGALTAQQTGPLVPNTAAPLRGAVTSKPCGFVFVDSEPKVVRAIVTEGSATYVPFASVADLVWDQNGRGNNWAWGYTGLASHRVKEGSEGKTSSLCARSMEAIRKQAELCDSPERVDRTTGPSGLIVMHSLGGGTGSGLGSRLLECCRDEYPKAPVLSIVVAPFSHGDTPLQHYNMALALASCNELSDAVLFFDNDDLMARARSSRRQATTRAASLSGPGAPTALSVASVRAAIRLERAGKGEETRGVSTTELNARAADALASILRPVWHRRLRPTNECASGSPSKPAWVTPTVPVEGSAFGGEADSEECSADVGSHGAGLGLSSASSGPRGIAASCAWHVDVQELIRLCVPQPSLKYLDVRAVSGGSSVSHASTWCELADELGDIVPRYRSGLVLPGDVAPGAPAPASTVVRTFAAHARCHGASMLDCDSVDPSLPAVITERGTDGSKKTASPVDRRDCRWSGLPQTEEWDTVALKLRRTYNIGCASVPSVYSQRLGGGRAARAPTREPTPLSASLSPAPGAHGERVLSVVANSDAATDRLLLCVSRVEALMRRRAYIHWYERFGVGAAHLQAAAESLLNVVDAYTEAGAAT